MTTSKRHTFHCQWHGDGDFTEVIAADEGVFSSVGELSGLDGEHGGEEVVLFLCNVNLVAAHLVLQSCLPLAPDEL